MTKKSMSTYENYSLTRRVYDKTRSAVGVEIISRILKEATVPMQEQILVDAGYGSDLYSSSLIDQVYTIKAVDINEGMLRTATTKMRSEIDLGRIHFQQGSIEAISLDDKSPNALIVNQVFHHLPFDTETNWEGLKGILKEFSRVLKPDSNLIINSCSPEQLDQGFWFCKLIPDALEKVKKKVIDLERLKELFRECGFINIQFEISLEIILQGDSYFVVEGILDFDWRSGDSIRNLVTNETLDEVLFKVKMMHLKGELSSYMRAQDRSRTETGQITFTHAQKSI